MNGEKEIRTGPLRYSEWKGLWKSDPGEDTVTAEEWDAAWKSLRKWLAARYLVDYNLQWRRHLWVEGDFAELERTLQITVWIPEVLTRGLLEYVQQWLRQGYQSWRVAIPTDNTDRNLILVYPSVIRINPQAEADLDGFLAEVRRKLAELIEQEMRLFGLPRKPYPPMPPDSLPIMGT